MDVCKKCKKELIEVRECLTGFPGYYVEGTLKKYCSFCNKPPMIELKSGLRGYKMIPIENKFQLEGAD